MKYFQVLTRPRQVVCPCVYALILLASMSIFAQQQQPDDKNKERLQTESTESQQIGENVQREPEATKERTAEKTILSEERFSAIRSDDKLYKLASPDIRQGSEFPPAKFSVENPFRKSSLSAQQSGDKDDTMMGVMGKGTDSIKLGGHVGFVVPIVGRGNGVTTNLGDRFVFGFPVGLTLKTKKNVAVDFEFIPTFNTGRDFVLTIHPGIIYGFAKKYAVGVRAAYDAGAGSFGFTPLISRGFKINDKLGWFIEADFPIRSNYNPYRDRFGSIAFAAHAGIAF